MLGGSGGMLRENFDKKPCRLVQSGRSRYVITILKINTFKVTKSTTTELNCHIFSQINVNVHAIRKWLELELKRGVWGAIPPEAEDF